MALYTGMVLADVTIVADGESVVVRKGAVLSLTAGGALETRIGVGNLQTITAGQDQSLPPGAAMIDN